MPQALILDDDPDFLSSLVELVKREGFEVTTASTIAEAREKLSKSVPGLLITDLMLPDGNGIDLLKDLPENPPDVVIVSGQATVETAVEALRFGALDYLTKPIDIPRLKSVLANVARCASH